MELISNNFLLLEPEAFRAGGRGRLRATRLSVAQPELGSSGLGGE